MYGIETVRENCCLTSVGNDSIWVPFQSRSDALLASLSMQQNLTWATLNSLLDIVSDPCFNASEVTLKNASDIDNRISSCRREESFSRSLKQSSAKIPVPLIVVEDVADHLAEQIMFSSRTMTKVRSWSVPPFDLAYKMDLRNMALVHRSWTEPAQRALRRNIILDGSDMRRFLRHPFCGPWIQEFRFRDGVIPHDHHETFVQLSSVLLQACNISDLFVKICKLRHVKIFSDFFKTVQSMPSLRKLHISCFIPDSDLIQYQGDEYPKLSDLFDVLPHMTRLEWLTLTAWQYNQRRDSTLPDRFHSTTPPSSLKTVAFSDDEMRIPSEYISWLVNARGEFQPRCLRFGGREDPTGVPRLLQAALDSLPTLEILELHCLLQDDFYLENFKAYVDRCAKLRVLILNYEITGHFDLPP